MGHLPEFKSEFLTDYMQMVEDTESPRLYHLWSAISCLSSSLGRRCWLPFGHLSIYPNQYIIFVGSPALRKSTAMNMGSKLLQKSTHVRLAPADTSGHRQGLIAAMRNEEPEVEEALDGVAVAGMDEGFKTMMSLDQISEIDNTDATQVDIAKADKHHLVINSSELSQLIGQNNRDLLTFLTTCYDGEQYTYQTKAGKMVIDDPLINLIGCTTPSSIANDLPPSAGGHGFLSRVILVYGEHKYKKVPRPKVPPESLVRQIKTRLNQVYYECSGAFTETPEAERFTEDIYDYTLEITDARFAYYAERRHTHFLKLGMALAAARGSMQIVKDDYDEAHRILRATERGMSDALGQFGLSPLAELKQGILEYLRDVGQPVDFMGIKVAFHRDARGTDIKEVLADLVTSGQVVQKNAPDNSLMFSAKKRVSDTTDDILNLLAEK